MRLIACFLFMSLVFSCKNMNSESKRIPVKSEYKGKVKTVKSGTEYFYKIHHFDSTGYDTAIYTYGNGNQLLTKATNKFDLNGYLLSSETFTVSTKIIYYTICTYSEDWTERNETYSSSHVAAKYDDRQFVQDIKGNLLAEYVLKGDQKVFMNKYTYDSSNHLILTNEFSEGCNITYTNDEHGNPVTAKYDYPKEKKSDTKTMTYVYDSSGNWIEKVVKNANGDIETKETSAIEYY